MQAARVGCQQVQNASCRQAFPSGAAEAVRARQVRCCSTSSEQKPKVTRPLQLTEEERQRQPGKHEILNVAEKDLEGFCSALPEDADSQECWDALQYYEDQRHQAEDACEVEWENSDGLTKPQCARLERFENFVREAVGEGHIVHFISTLQTLSRIDKRRLAKELGEDGKDSSHKSEHLGITEAAQKVQESLDASTNTVNESDANERKSRVRELFHAMDKDHNGKLDVGEFREAMRELGDEMSGTSVATVLDAMDVHGFISLDQFIAIVEAEAIESHSADARMLRRLSKDPIWWTRSMD